MKKSVQTDCNPILKSIESISLAFKDVELNSDNKKRILSKVKKDLKVVADFLYCSEEEAWLFAVMFAMSISGKETDLESLTIYLNCNPFLIVSFSPILESLVNKRLLVKNAGYDMKILSTRYYISSFIFNSITLNKAVPKSNPYEDVYEVIEKINEMMCDREKNNITTDELFTESLDLLKKEGHFPLIKKILDLNITFDDTLLLIYLCYSFANESNEADIERFIYYVYDSLGNKIRAKKNLFSGNCKLIEDDLVSFVDDSFYGGKALSLTDKAIEMLFSEDVGLLEKKKTFNPRHFIVLHPDKIRASKLFFNNEEKKQIGLLEKILLEENFLKAKKKFESMGFPPGFTVLFYGDPGTGKTQVAYNLAKESGRVILMVDISSIRDKYVGESEKRIKQIFKTYRQAREHFDLCPVLFFNESDALISKRFEVTSSVDQMNNSMQNILLQELEDFEGILIATSNMNTNLDSAFERRFLYKIVFERPDAETRFKIWKEKMPSLSEEEIKILADTYLLTGGQIHNISRKYLLNNILKESHPNLKELQQLCEWEYFGRKANNLGFKRNISE